MSYQIQCPTCDTVIPPDKINIQKMIAVCPNCGSVFNFTDKVNNVNKVKRRKIRKPDYITQTDTDDSVTLEMPYLHTMPYKLLSTLGGFGMVAVYAFIMREIISDGDGIMVMVFFSLIILPIILGFFGSLFAKQIIEANTEHLKHEIRLGIPVYQRKMNIDDVVDVSAEETAATRESIAEARYNLFADKYDKRQDMFIQTLPEDTALYSQQVLSSYFNANTADADRLRLVDEDDTMHDDALYEHQEAEQMKQQRS